MFIFDDFFNHFNYDFSIESKCCGLSSQLLLVQRNLVQSKLSSRRLFIIVLLSAPPANHFNFKWQIFENKPFIAIYYQNFKMNLELLGEFFTLIPSF